jgi:hypothetical protein
MIATYLFMAEPELLCPVCYADAAATYRLRIGACEVLSEGWNGLGSPVSLFTIQYPYPHPYSVAKILRHIELRTVVSRKILLLKDLAAESSQERTYGSFPA